MDFVGTGQRLVEADYKTAAAALDVETALVKAVVEVEAASYGFDDRDRPRILNEAHVFWRELGPGPARDRAAARRLAAPKWGDLPYPRTSDDRYRWLEAAMAIDNYAALRSCSWGLGQVMGFNHELAGFADIGAFIDAMRASEGAQLLAMVEFIDATGLAGPLRRKDFAAFARGYNGPGYAKHQYDKRIERAYRRFRAETGAEIAVRGGGAGDSRPMLRRGSRGEDVKRAQERLAVYGHYRGDVDGDFGPLTEMAVRGFQAAHPATGLVDGVIGKATWSVLLSDIAEADPDDAIPAPSGADSEEGS